MTSRLYFYGFSAAAYVALCVFCVINVRPRIEEDLVYRTSRALIKKGIRYASVKFAGRDAGVSLRGANNDIVERAKRIATSVYGVRQVQVTSLPEIFPELDVRKDGGQVHLYGKFPDKDSRDGWVSAATYIFGQNAVRSEIQVSDEVSKPAYLENLKLLLQLLKEEPGLNRFELSQNKFQLHGEVSTKQEQERIEGDAAELVPSTLELLSLIQIHKGLEEVPPREPAKSEPVLSEPAPPEATPGEHTESERIKSEPTKSHSEKKTSKKRKSGKRASGAMLENLRLGFSFNSTRIVSNSREALSEAARLLRENAGLKIKLLGYCDGRGPAAYNLKLSQRRAKAVRSLLLRKGIAADRIEIEGRGATEFLAENDSEAGRALNRRVEFRLIDGFSYANPNPEASPRPIRIRRASVGEGQTVSGVQTSNIPSNFADFIGVVESRSFAVLLGILKNVEKNDEAISRDTFAEPGLREGAFSAHGRGLRGTFCYIS